MLAEHSRTTRVKQYVYNDPDWNEAVQRFMVKGWWAEMPREYVNKLEKVFNMNLKIKSYRAHDIFKSLIVELFKRTKNGKWVKLMLNKTATLPKIPIINQKSWEFAFVQKMMENKKHHKNFISFVKKLHGTLSSKEITQYYNKYFPGKKWKINMIDILEFLKQNNIVKLYYDSTGNITSLTKVSNKIPNL